MSPALIRAVVLTLALLVGTPAGAYRMIVEPTTPIDPMGRYPGDNVSWDIFLDTQGESGITLLSFSRT